MQHSPMACIRKAAIFKNLPNEMLEKLVPISTHQEYFPKGSIIRQPGDGKNGMLFMDQGSAKIYNLNEDGKETVLGVLNQGDANGQQNLFKNMPRKTLCRLYKILMFVLLSVVIFKSY